MTNKEIIQISKSKPKKISILGTFKNQHIGHFMSLCDQIPKYIPMYAEPLLM